uniref:Uncharacterized protein n=1 Tax=Megaselia scalaris TaxID=36166 RepID=T1GTQ5_MEGSC
MALLTPKIVESMLGKYRQDLVFTAHFIPSTIREYDVLTSILLYTFLATWQYSIDQHGLATFIYNQ